MKIPLERKKDRNAYIFVKCAECEASLRRRPLRPKDYAPIKHFFCGFPCKALFQKRAKPVSREWLEQKYVVEGLDCVQIGLIVSRDPKSVWNWLVDFQIPTRPRGSDVRQQFVKGAPNPFTGMRHTEKSKAAMSAIAKDAGRMPYKKENGPPWKGITGERHPTWKGGLTPERQSFYASDQWKDAVKFIWHRADATCERCGTRHNTKAARGSFHIHHVVSFMVRELRSEPANLVLLCRSCHKFVHSKNNTTKELIRKL